MPLAEGDRRKMSLPQTLVPLLREAIQIEVIVKGAEARFLLLHLDAMQKGLLRSCRTD